jgi:hypothetical protein
MHKRPRIYYDEECCTTKNDDDDGGGREESRRTNRIGENRTNSTSDESIENTNQNSHQSKSKKNSTTSFPRHKKDSSHIAIPKTKPREVKYNKANDEIDISNPKKITIPKLQNSPLVCRK